MSQEQEDRDLQEIRATIAFGLDCKDWMGSAFGRYLTAKANADIDTALDGLKTADAEDPKAIRKLQNDIASAERFLLWMGEAVTDGENAERVFIESQN